MLVHQIKITNSFLTVLTFIYLALGFLSLFYGIRLLGVLHGTYCIVVLLYSSITKKALV